MHDNLHGSKCPFRLLPRAVLGSDVNMSPTDLASAEPTTPTDSPQGVGSNARSDDRDSVSRQVEMLVSEMGAIELGALYGTVGMLFDKDVHLDVALTLSNLVREKAIDIEGRVADKPKGGPLVGIVKTTDRQESFDSSESRNRLLC